MIEYILQPWPWYVAGPLIGLTIPILLLIDNKPFGLSSSFNHLCSISKKSNIPLFDYNWKDYTWNLALVFGLFLGGFIAVHFLSANETFPLSANTISILNSYGISEAKGFLPMELMGWENILTLKGLFFIVLGGFSVGFGTRYANGCTSGHAIMGLSNLSLTSLIATITFFATGILTVHFLLPIVLG